MTKDKHVGLKHRVHEIYGHHNSRKTRRDPYSIHHIVRLSDKFLPFGCESKDVMSNYFSIRRSEYDVVERMIDAGSISNYKRLTDKNFRF